MAVCSVQDLISQDPCIATLSSHMRKVVKVQMLCGLYNNLNSGDPLTCDIQTLLDDAACFATLSDAELEILEIALLCNIFGLL